LTSENEVMLVTSYDNTRPDGAATLRWPSCGAERFQRVDAGGTPTKNTLGRTFCPLGDAAMQELADVLKSKR
jgi:hypothetical protein